MVLFLLKDQFGLTEELSTAISALKEVKFCIHCHNISDGDICQICASPKRNNRIICIVESIRDIMAIEETGRYNGLYHVLGGVISPLDGVGPADLNIETLQNRISGNQVDELIMAISPTIDGETTIYYLSRVLPGELQISTIARGVSFGGELEYADEVTLGRSISSRVPYDAKSGTNT